MTQTNKIVWGCNPPGNLTVIGQHVCGKTRCGHVLIKLQRYNGDPTYLIQFIGGRFDGMSTTETTLGRAKDYAQILIEMWDQDCPENDDRR